MSQTGGPGQPFTGFQLSPDGNWWWDGAAWRSALSPDGRTRWTGYAWVETGAGSPSTGISGGLIALIAGSVAVVLIVVSVMTYVAIHAWSGAGPAPVGPGQGANQIPCDQLEHTQVHYHAYLQIVADGDIVPIPTSVGRTPSCYYWLHMHTGEQGMIHIEAPSDRTFTLADFFWVWSAWSGRHQLLDPTHVSTLTLSDGQTLVVYVDADDGSGPHVYSGNPQNIVLQDHEMITLEITPPLVSPPPAYTWPAGF